MEVGLIGWMTHSGLGYVNNDLWSTGRFSRWILVRHPKLGIADDMSIIDDRFKIVDPAGGSIAESIKGLDAIVAVEQPYRAHQELFDVADSLGVASCLVPMVEWLPVPSSPEWAKWGCKPDMIFAPTKWSLEQCVATATPAARCNWKNRIVGGRWGVDLTGAMRIRRRRITADRFLFCNGWGGVSGRKGLEALLLAARRVPQASILVRSQAAVAASKVPANVEIVTDDVSDRWSIYREGDVLLAPSRWEGLGLHLYEAQACGIPVMTTNADPMRQAGPVKLIACERAGGVNINGRSVQAWDVKIDHFAMMLRTLAGTNIEKGSDMAVEHVTNRHDIRSVVDDLFREIGICIDDKRASRLA